MRHISILPRKPFLLGQIHHSTSFEEEIEGVRMEKKEENEKFGVSKVPLANSIIYLVILAKNLRRRPEGRLNGSEIS
jgi:hypothetical protein